MATTKRQLTEAEREQRRAQDRERLRAAAEQLLCSDGWRCWVRTRSSNALAEVRGIYAVTGHDQLSIADLWAHRVVVL